MSSGSLDSSVRWRGCTATAQESTQCPIGDHCAQEHEQQPGYGTWQYLLVEQQRAPEQRRER